MGRTSVAVVASRGPAWSAFVALSLAAGGCDSGPVVRMGDVEFSGVAESGEPNMMVTAAGDVVLSWHERIGDNRMLRFAVRSDGVWGEPETLAEGLPFFINWADVPSMIELADGTWGVHWLQRIPDVVFAYDVMLALSSDRGRTWGEPFSPHDDGTLTEHGFASLARNGPGFGALWLDGRQTATDPPGPMSLRFASATAAGLDGRDMLVDERVCDCCNTALATVSGGLLAAYRDRSEQDIRDIAVRRYDGDSWSDPLHVGNDNWYYPGCPVNGPALSAVGDDVALAWYSAPEQQAHVSIAFSDDGGATFGEAILMDEGTTLGRVDVELLDDGWALMVWLRHEGDIGYVIAATVHRDGTRGTAWTVAETDPSRGSGFPRVARVGSELVFAWTETGPDGGVRVSAATWN